MTTLLDVLNEFKYPNIIDYLGMDCEGSEYNILEHNFLNNKNYLIRFIAIEVGRSDLVDLIKNNNYIELINPIIPKYCDQKVTWERYFIHKTEINGIDNQILN